MKKRLAAFLIVGFLAASPTYADTFVWTFSGVADSGHWDLSDLTGLAYTLRLTTDSAAPDQNGFNDFGNYFNLLAEIDIQTLGTRTLGNFTFVEQFSTATSDRLRVRGPNGGTESVLQIPVGTVGDPDFLSVWGPVQTLGVSGNLKIDDPGVPNPPFQLVDLDNAESRITVSTSAVPEPATLALLGIGVGIGTMRRRNQRQISELPRLLDSQ